MSQDKPLEIVMICAQHAREREALMTELTRPLQAKEAIALRIKLRERIEDAQSMARRLADGTVDYLLERALDALQVTSLRADLEDVHRKGGLGIGWVNLDREHRQQPLFAGRLLFV
jgi:hypothetical protein